MACFNLKNAQGICVRNETNVCRSGCVPLYRSPARAQVIRCQASQATTVVTTPQEVSEKVKQVKTEAKQPEQPGKDGLMKVKPMYINDTYKGSGKLQGKRVIITGGDSGIGRSVAMHFAREGAAGIAIIYRNEEEDAKKTVELVKAEGCSNCVHVPGDVGDPEFCQRTVDQVVKDLGGLDILVNNAGEQHKQESIMNITPEQLQRTFSSDIFAMFYLVKAALPHLKEGSAIINTSSVLGYLGKEVLLDYASAKGAVATFTRSLAIQLAEKGIRVNAVAPGPVWTPAIPASMGEGVADGFAETENLLKRGGQPCEVAPTFVFLASDVMSSFFTGQVLHANGGMIMNN